MNSPKSIPTNNPDNLLHTKLMPPRLHAALLPRPELFHRLLDGQNKKPTVVTASIGFGKTTLARMWVEGQQASTAWVTLDEMDNGPIRFWTYVITAIRTFSETLGKLALTMLMASHPPSFQAALTSLINDLSQVPGSLVLVLDEYQVITSTEIRDTLSFLLQHLPQSLHLVLISRNEPTLPLALLRAHDELIEVNASDLRFTLNEAEEFFRAITSFDLPNEIVKSLHERTEGWPAGLRLASLLSETLTLAILPRWKRG